MLIPPRRRRSRVPESIRLPARWPWLALRAVVLLVVGVGLVCARADRRPGPTDDRTRYHDQTFRVARVIDGDTLDIQSPDGDKPLTRIRLWGVDAPEVGRGRERDMYYGADAQAFAEESLDGRTVHVVLSPDQSRDRYGRLLAYVFLERGGRMFNEMLLEHGFAYADVRFKHLYDERFEALEKRARKTGAGLWAAATVDQMPSWRQRAENRRSTRRAENSAAPSDD